MKNRIYHQATAWFNTLFNGQKAMDAKLQERKNTHRDDYFQILSTSPYGIFEKNEAPQEVAYTAGQGIGLFKKVQSGDLLNAENSAKTGFEKAEEKALKAIEQHAMQINGIERNKMMGEAYLMLGKSRYYQGKSFQAIEALEQVKRMPFDKYKNEAEYFIALAQLQAGNQLSAGDVLKSLYAKKTNKFLKPLIAQSYAEWLYATDSVEEALSVLEVAIKSTKDKKQAARLYFIQGQMLTTLEKYSEANQSFSKAYKLKPSYEMEVRAQVAKAFNFQPKRDAYTDYQGELNLMLSKGTYQKYKNELYYALGVINEKRDSFKKAKEYYFQALRQPLSDTRYRAETFASLAKIYLKSAEYVYANAYYDSAVAVLPPSQRKENLAELSKNLNTVMQLHYLVMRNDSVLNIASLNETEQKAFFNEYIEKLKRKDESEQKASENKVTEYRIQNKATAFSTSFSQGKKFYFYSESTRNNGENEFRRIWGNIPLQENWRNQGNAISSQSIEEVKANLTGKAKSQNPRRYEVEYYMEQIPKEKTLKQLKIERDTVQLNLGIVYNDLLQDTAKATETLEQLLLSPPIEDSVKEQTYFQLYRINQGKEESLAQKYKDDLLRKYPQSLYAQYIKNPKILVEDNNTTEAVQLYEKAYELYKEDDFQAIESLTENIDDTLLSQPITAKTLLLKSFAKYKIGKKEEFRELLKKIQQQYQGKEEAQWATEKLQYLLKPEEERTISPQQKQKESPQLRAKPDEEEQVINQGVSIFMR